MVTKKDDHGHLSQVVLVNPGKPFYKSDEGGLFWTINHQEGIYLLEASKLVEYSETTPKPIRGHRAVILSKGMY